MFERFITKKKILEMTPSLKKEMLYATSRLTEEILDQYKQCAVFLMTNNILEEDIKVDILYVVGIKDDGSDGEILWIQAFKEYGEESWDNLENYFK